MRTIYLVGLLVIGGVVFWLYQNAQPRNILPPTAAPVAASAPVLATPTGAPIASAPVIAKRTAPPGTLFTLQRISKTTDAGVVAILPGEKVSLVERKVASVRVSDGQNEFEAESSSFTDDLDLAESAKKGHLSSQQALAAWTQQQKALAAKVDKETADRQVEVAKAQAARDLELARIGAQKPQATPRVSALDRGAYDQHRGVAHRAYYYDRYGYHYYVDAYGRWVYY